MDWIWKAALAAATVLIVMAVARRSGRRMAGVAAALPTITAPTLAWLVHERGVSFAMSAAISSVSACAMLAFFAFGYAFAARHGGQVRALLCGLAGALALAWPAFAASDSLSEALVLGLACSVLALFGVPRMAHEAVVRSRPPLSLRSLVWAALAAGGVTALAANAGPAFGSFATGLLASLPVISAAVAMVEHAHGGHRAAANFLHGYAWGLLGKAGFGAVFVLLAPRTGAPAALVLACAFSGLMSLVQPGHLLLVMRSRLGPTWRG